LLQQQAPMWACRQVCVAHKQEKMLINECMPCCNRCIFAHNENCMTGWPHNRSFVSFCLQICRSLLCSLRCW
jgi:hypothetical protein